ncbi:mycothiol transferase [Kocuria nitroreducens]|uniref:mycothiol transferase n=1 Tax=Kocuria nitroreducens TaxID=3058914 RepID=UPI0036D8D8F4
MPFLTPTVTDERDALATFASQQIRQVATTLQGLDADQLRATPSASAMSLGALARHVLFIGGNGPFAVLTDPGRTPAEPLDGAGYAAGAVLPDAVLPEDTAESLRAALHALADRVEAGLRTADPEARIPVPEAPWFPQDLGSWPARWVALHMVEENGRHAGHADILRESLDGKTAYELNALADGEQWSPES